MDDGTLAVATRGLGKTFRTRKGRRYAVHGLDLDVPAGGVHGFLGPNGSGKTTTIRMLLGLAKADEGTMHVFGVPVPQRLPEVIGRMGAIVETPKFFPAFTARRNLSLLAQGIGTPQSRVQEVLTEVGLGDRGDDRFAAYSLGMKQRLAIAATLLKSPDLLIFDEPTNGLDPAGIREVRQTMRRLGDEGKTVLVSSHILSEVEQVADTVSIIGRGRVLAQGRVQDLIGDTTAGLVVEIEVADPDTATAVLTRAGLTVTRAAQAAGEDPAGEDAATAPLTPVGPGHDGHSLTVTGADSPADVTRTLAHQGIYVSRLVPVRRGLESVFLELTGDDQLGAGS